MNQIHRPDRFGYSRFGYSRFGYSLIELMMLMSIIAILLSINAIWIGKSLQFSTAMRERHQDHLNLTRLSNELRFNVSHASDWSMPKPDELSLECLDGVRVRYKFEKKSNGSIVRSERLEKERPQGKLADENSKTKPETASSKEQFRLSPNCELHVDAADFPKSLSIVVYRVPNIPNPPPSETSQTEGVASKGSGSIHPLFSDRSEKPVEAVIKLVPNRFPNPLGGKALEMEDLQ